MSVTKPIPFHPSPAVPMCPICGKASYSRDGTHPQCSLARADAISTAARKAADALAGDSVDSKATPSQCPKCKRPVTPRRNACLCGYKLAADPPLPTAQANRAHTRREKKPR